MVPEPQVQNANSHVRHAVFRRALDCGVVTVNGGTVTAHGDTNGAGIGGGTNCAGGTVTINGGTVTANGGRGGAGIGGGNGGTGGTVTINGGTVTATGSMGAGIGGGRGGAGGSVSINGGAVTATGDSGAGIGGSDGGDNGKVTFGAGAWLVLAGRFAPDTEVSAESYTNNHSAAYVSIEPLLSLKIPEGMHYSYVVSNETTGTALEGVSADGTNTYSVKNGSTVKVYFTLDEDYEWDGEFDNPKDLGVIESDKVVDASEMPKAKGLPGSETNPWKVGETVTAHIKDRVLYLKGTGAMDDFARAADVPWAAVAGEVTAVAVEEGVTKIGKNALAGIGDDVTVNGTPLSTYRTVSSVETKINGMPLADYNAVVRRLNVGEEWKEASPASSEPPVPVPPAGAVTSWDALTNAVDTAESGAVIAVGADISEEGGELVVPAGKAVTIKLYGKTATCAQVTVNGALTVGDADDSVGRIVASDGAKLAKSGSVTLLNGPVRGTFTTKSRGVALVFR